MMFWIEWLRHKLYIRPYVLAMFYTSNFADKPKISDSA